MALRVNKDTFSASLAGEERLVLAEFYSDSCIPCKQLAPILGDIEDDYEDRVKVIKVNINFDPELAEQFQVLASPTLIFFREGKEVERIRGIAGREIIENKVKEL